VFARNLSLALGTSYNFYLTVPSAAEFGMFLYSSIPDSNGEPILLKRSTIPIRGAMEAISYTSSSTGVYYIVVKQVHGSGQFTLSTTSEINTPSASWIGPVNKVTISGNLTIEISAVDIDGSISNVLISFDDDGYFTDITTKLNGSSGNYEFSLNSSQFTEGWHGILGIVKDNDGKVTYLGGRTFYVRNAQPRILLVDDDDGDSFEQYYEESLDALGFQEVIGYDLWEVSSLGSPSSSALSSYQSVIWFTGLDFSTTLTSTDQANLQSYLNSGGNLFLSGQDIGYDIGGVSFYQNYLHAAYITDIASNNSGIIGTPGDPIFDSTTYALNGGDGAQNNLYPDVVSPTASSSTAMFYSGYFTENATITFAGTYNLVYVAFPFESISTRSERIDFLNRTLNFLTVPPDSPPIVTITTPSDYQIVSSTDLDLQWNGVDDNSISYYHIFMDGENVAHTPLTSHIITGIPEGEHIIRIVGFDSLNQRDIGRVRLFVDYTSPLLNIITPINGTFTQSNQIQVQWTGSDLGAGIDYFEIFLNGILSDTTSLMTSLVSLDLDGAHNLTIKARDKAGNLQVETKWIIRDQGFPSVTITNPGNDSITQASSVSVSWSSSDSLSGIAITALFVDEVLIFSEFPGIATKNMTLTRSISLGTYGYHNITAVATDLAGNTQHDTIWVLRETTSQPLTTTGTKTDSSTNTTTKGAVSPGLLIIPVMANILVLSVLVIKKRRTLGNE
jgi:hypothetical protein